jgi:phosphoribosylglycinamide formyltransferase-1
MDSALRERGIKVVCLAGYMRILTPFLVQRWDGRMLNIHPSLLPAFPGLDTHRRALAAKVTRHGCTVHLVTEGMDEGPILGQASLLIQPGETEESLAARVLQLEHALYPWVLRHFIEGL